MTSICSRGQAPRWEIKDPLIFLIFFDLHGALEREGCKGAQEILCP